MNHRTIKRIIPAAIALLALTGCFELPEQARDPFPQAKQGQSITVSSDGPPGISVAESIAPWNRLAGWDLFVLVKGPADIDFKPREMAHAFWAPCKANHCTIYYDTGYMNDWVVSWNAGTLGHEYGHAFYNDSIGDSNYQGVMSYNSFYAEAHRATYWFKADDRDMLERDGLAR